MINKFMTVYAGHIDIPDHGQNAAPAVIARTAKAAQSSSGEKHTVSNRTAP